MTALLQTISLFNALDESLLSQIAQISTRIHYQKGEILFYEGDESNHLHILIHGIVRIFKTDIHGNEVVIHRFEHPTLIAEMANFYHMRFPATALFETDSTVIKINYPLFETHFLKNPAISFEFVRSLSQKIKHLENVIASHLSLDASGRIAKFILEHEAEFIQMKRHEVATILKITPVTLSRIMKKFKSNGWIEDSQSGLHIRDRSRLQKLYTLS